ncbi:hypothetical protein [Geothrix sp. 21YS21S-2]|uniref:LpxL/LpxP family acyltransferase n=1 Tax=Geothrix sp. 21YS21S-2 TaxID=3068893 RepID=UPI0027BA7B0D|nr:hypothetical protein [Geothrix sp. 21YS21S-2]
MEPGRIEWRIRGIGTRWQLGFFHGLIRLAGRSVAYALADLVSLYYTLTRPSIRHRCRPYLAHRFPGRTGLRRLVDTFRLSRTFARLMVDQAAQRILGRGEFITHLRGRADLAALLAEGRGLVIVTAHVGAWQLGMANLAHLDRPISVLARFDAGDASSPFQAFAGRDFRIIDPEAFLGGVPDMLGALQRGEVLCLMGDRAWGASGGTVAVDFLGGPVPLPFTAYKLASATGAPVAVLFPFKPGPDQYEMQLAAVVRVPPGLGRAPEAYLPYAAAYAQALAGFLDAYPYHFFNFFDLWAGETGPR